MPSETLPGTRRDCIAPVTGDIKRHREDRHTKTATWMEVTLDIAVTHHQRVAVWVGMWSPHLIQLLETRFKSSSSTYNNALSNLTEKQLTFYRKALKDLSKTLVEAGGV